MKLAVVGSRTFNNYDLLKCKLDVIHEKKVITCIISGGAKGADSLAEKWSKENNIETLIFKPDWDKYGKRAGFLRNEDIIKNSDAVVAFWDGISHGTKNDIDLAKKYNKPCLIVRF
jgi:hypothetical protein